MVCQSDHLLPLKFDTSILTKNGEKANLISLGYRQNDGGQTSKTTGKLLIITE